LAGDGVPDSNHSVPAGRGQALLPVPPHRTKCHAACAAAVAGQDMQVVPVDGVPDAHGPIQAGRGQHFTIRAKGDAGDGIAVEWGKSSNELAGLGVPNPHGPQSPGGGKWPAWIFAIRTEGYLEDEFLPFRAQFRHQADSRPAAGHVPESYDPVCAGRGEERLMWSKSHAPDHTGVPGKGLPALAGACLPNAHTAI